jgi:hypothetical protein
VPASAIILPSAARTATVASAALSGRRFRGVSLYVKITAGTTLSITPQLEGLDQASGDWYLLLAGTALTGVSVKRLTVAPGITVVANASAADVLPDQWRVNMVHGNANSATYTVGASLIAA